MFYFLTKKVHYTNKVDLKNQFLNNNKTYLHLAAHKAPDINSMDQFGMTPLMIACKYKKRENIELLFKFSNLDYLQCNEKEMMH